MNDKESKAIEVLRFFAEKTGCLIAYSGGKDSDVLLHLAIKSKIPIKVVHSHTTVDAPETVYYVRETFKRLTEQGIENYVEYPQETMWQLIVRKRMPPTRRVRYCCSVLKEQTGVGEKVATGVRWAESKNREDLNGIATIPNPSKQEKGFVNNDSIVNSKRGG